MSSVLFKHQQLNRFLSRSIAFFLLLTGFFVFFLFLYKVNENFKNWEGEYSYYETEISKLKIVAGSVNKIENKNGIINDSSVKNLFISEDTSSRSRAEFQTHIKRLAQENGVTIGSIIEKESFDNNGVIWLYLNLQATGSTMSLHNFIREIESYIPFFFIESARIVGDRDPVRATTPAAILRVDLAVSAAVLPGER